MSESLYEEARDIDSEEFEVVPADEPSIEDYPPTPDHPVDEYGAPIKKPVRVIDGVRDSVRR